MLVRLCYEGQALKGILGWLGQEGQARKVMLGGLSQGDQASLLKMGGELGCVKTFETHQCHIKAKTERNTPTIETASAYLGCFYSLLQLKHYILGQFGGVFPPSTPFSQRGQVISFKPLGILMKESMNILIVKLKILYLLAALVGMKLCQGNM